MWKDFSLADKAVFILVPLLIVSMLFLFTVVKDVNDIERQAMISQCSKIGLRFKEVVVNSETEYIVCSVR